MKWSPRQPGHIPLRRHRTNLGHWSTKGHLQLDNLTAIDTMTFAYVTFTSFHFGCALTTVNTTSVHSLNLLQMFFCKIYPPMKSFTKYSVQTDLCFSFSVLFYKGGCVLDENCKYSPSRFRNEQLLMPSSNEELYEPGGIGDRFTDFLFEESEKWLILDYHD